MNVAFIEFLVLLPWPHNKAGIREKTRLIELRKYNGAWYPGGHYFHYYIGAMSSRLNHCNPTWVIEGCPIPVTSLVVLSIMSCHVREISANEGRRHTSSVVVHCLRPLSYVI